MLGFWDLNPLVRTETIGPSFIGKMLTIDPTAEDDNRVRCGTVTHSKPTAWRWADAREALCPGLVPIVEHPGVPVLHRFRVVFAAEQHEAILFVVIG